MKYYKLIFLLPVISVFHFVNNNDFESSSNPLLKNVKSAGYFSEYEVRLTHTGYFAFSGTARDCQIRTNGKVILTGTVKGDELVDAADDIMYTGILQLSINFDICSAKRVNGEDKLCSMTVKGSGSVEVELEIYSDGQDTARGAYIKIQHDSTTLGRFTRSVNGTCDLAEMAEEKDMIPNETVATIFNGKDLPMLKERRLRVGRYVERDGQHETVVEVLRKIR